MKPKVLQLQEISKIFLSLELPPVRMNSISKNIFLKTVSLEAKTNKSRTKYFYLYSPKTYLLHFNLKGILQNIIFKSFDYLAVKHKWKGMDLELEKT